ncbi:protein of unknown function [Magnetospirillum sp. XM-1]|uniref:hypothetical protein n=1 Tax=Magnetospirillum sp. XM-1 TaxID=1663591 RepID=UPI00073DFBAE|nr:protein of unknown function [Magnetospirillum sp. XM-1]
MTHVRTSLDRVLTARRDPDKVKRDGWHEVGVLAVSVDDGRLDAFERQFLINLGNRLYGPRNGGDGAVVTGTSADTPPATFDAKRLNASGGGL